jgi:hypothetical protein
MHAKHPIFNTIGINKGLLSSSINYVLNNKQGYIWIASDWVLNKFDGRNINSIQTIKGNYFHSVLFLDEDKKGTTYLLSGYKDKDKLSISDSYSRFEIQHPFWTTWWFIFLCVTVFFMITVVIFNWRLNIQKKKLIENVKVNKLIAESQVTAIRAQMNPHFIFNSITSIQDLVLNNDTQNAYNYLSQFAKLIRLVLNNSKKNYISLEKEIEWLKIYITLEQLRFKNKFEFVLELDEEINESTDIKIPTMVIQPYIENAIWHGLMPLNDSKKGILTLKMKVNENEIKIIIEDNGIDRSSVMNNKENDVCSSMGMYLVNEKIDALTRLEKNDVKVTSKELYEGNVPSGTRVEIVIQY